MNKNELIFKIANEYYDMYNLKMKYKTLHLFPFSELGQEIQDKCNLNKILRQLQIFKRSR